MDRYGEREAILVAAVAVLAEEGIGALNAATDETSLERLRHGFVLYREWSLEYTTHDVLMFAASATGYEPGEAGWADADGSSDDLRDRVTAAVVSRELTRVPPDAALHPWSTAHGYVMLEIAGPGKQHDDPRVLYCAGIDALLGTYR